MQMELFHGSDHIIEKPLFHGGKRHNDYGYGFYTTEVADMAREWAVDKDRSGYLNRYAFSMDQMRILDLQDPQYCVLHWLEILLENRTFLKISPLAVEGSRYLRQYFHVDYEDFDVIKGYRADDSYFAYAQDFLNGVISVQQLSRAMKLGKLGEQIVLKSQEAFDALIYKGYESVDSATWFPRKELRDHAARNDYLNLNKGPYQRGELYMIQILDEEVNPNDKRLR